MFRLKVSLAALALVATACNGGGGGGGGNPGGRPTVLSTSPDAGDENVARNTVIRAVFSEAMNADTIDETSFVLMHGTTASLGVVAYAGTAATLTLSEIFPSNTVFTATISTAAEDLDGNGLLAEKTWSFTTVETSVNGPAVVALGSAGNFVLLAKVGISTTGATDITGDIGLSPAAPTFFTGFGESSPPTTTTTSAIVTGFLYGSTYLEPTPTNLGVAVLDMQAAYDDAAGRTLPDFTELAGGNIDGLTLAPGLYKWAGTVSFPTGITLAGGPNDVWIFQIAGQLTVGNGAIVGLSGGASPRNIFWQVAQETTLGTTTQMKGVILGKTLIAMQTNSVLVGQGLAQTEVTLDAATISNP